MFRNQNFDNAALTSTRWILHVGLPQEQGEIYSHCRIEITALNCLFYVHNHRCTLHGRPTWMLWKPTCGARSLCLTLEWSGGQSSTCEWELINALQARVTTLRTNFQQESWKFLCVISSYSSKLNKLPTHWLCDCFIDLQDDIAEASLSNLKLGYKSCPRIVFSVFGAV